MSLLAEKGPHSNNPKWLIVSLSLIKTVNVAIHSKSQNRIKKTILNLQNRFSFCFLGKLYGQIIHVATTRHMVIF